MTTIRKRQDIIVLLMVIVTSHLASLLFAYLFDVIHTVCYASLLC